MNSLWIVCIVLRSNKTEAIRNKYRGAKFMKVSDLPELKGEVGHEVSQCFYPLHCLLMQILFRFYKWSIIFNHVLFMMKCFNNIFFRQIIISSPRWCDDQPPAAVHGRGREGEGGKADLETFIYSLTSISLTLNVVFVSFVHVLNPLLNLSRSGGPRRLWGCSWTSRGPYANIREYIDYSCDLLPVLFFPGASEEMVWMETILESFWYIFPHICLYMKYIDPDINFAFLAWCR